jgi:hypothetical protein
MEATISKENASFVIPMVTSNNIIAMGPFTSLIQQRAKNKAFLPRLIHRMEDSSDTASRWTKSLSSSARRWMLPANHPALSFIFSTSLKGEKSSKSSHLI